MSEVILKVENVSKQYRLGMVGTGTISHDLNRFLARIRGKEDPYLKIGESNDRSQKGVSDYVWALEDISFKVTKGEVLGIIGKNGAGKSTLLKILSKVTGPTIGSIKYNGRIASLLEVGTGFHPEMTGKENVFLNGAILGMTKKEISTKIDEIVAFSGCERYIDTPVKRYSSGMKVRLAFAVAAFLEPDILVVDEVLAVGDAEFQKKAVGKMQDISDTNGRTVLFVSHNMTAVKSLCTRCIVLENGKLVYNGNTNDAIDYYGKICLESLEKENIHIQTSKMIKVSDIKTYKNDIQISSNSTIFLGEKISMKFMIEAHDIFDDVSIAIDLNNDKMELISHLVNEDDGLSLTKISKNEKVEINIVTDKLLMVPGGYNLNLWIGLGHVQTLYEIKNFFKFIIEAGDYTKRTRGIPKHSKFYLNSQWSINKD